MLMVHDITRLKQLEAKNIPISNLLKKYVQDPNGKKVLTLVINSSVHLLNVIEDALDLSRIDNNDCEANISYSNIKQLVEEVINTLRFQTENKNLLLYTIYSLNMIPSDSKRFKQIIFNLIGNAIKFTYKGSITLRFSVDQKDLVTEVIYTGIEI